MQTADHDFYTTRMSRTSDTSRDLSSRSSVQSSGTSNATAAPQHMGVAGRVMNVIAVAIDATLGRYDR
jgi:hypothetical protein